MEQRQQRTMAFLERAMGIEPKNFILSLADSTPLAAVTRSNPSFQYPVLDYSWTTRMRRTPALWEYRSESTKSDHVGDTVNIIASSAVNNAAMSKSICEFLGPVIRAH